MGRRFCIAMGHPPQERAHLERSPTKFGIRPMSREMLVARTVTAYAWAVRVRDRVRRAHAGGRAGLQTDVGGRHSYWWFGSGGFHGARCLRAVASSAGDLSTCHDGGEIAH